MPATLPEGGSTLVEKPFQDPYYIYDAGHALALTTIEDTTHAFESGIADYQEKNGYPSDYPGITVLSGDSNAVFTHETDGLRNLGR